MYRVMLVDDEPFILDGLRKLIAWDELGLEIAAEATDGFQALDILKDIKIDILLTDIKMPNLNGIELLRSIKQLGLNIKTIILSGYDDFEFVKEGILLGIENYLLKSVDEEELTMTLLNTVDKIENELFKKIRARQDDKILKENILYRWVTGKIGSTELSERASLLGIDISCSSFQVCILKLMETKEHAKIQEDDLKQFAVLNICSEVIGGEENGVVFSGMHNEAVILFKSDIDNQFKLNPHEILEKCIRNINRFLSINAFAVIGCYVRESNSVYKSYESAKSLMDYSLILPYNTVIDCSYHQNLAAERQNLIDFDNLKKSIAKKDLAGTIQFIDDTFKSFEVLNWITPKYLRDISTEILYNILNSISPAQKAALSQSEPSESFYSKLLKIDSISDMSEWLKNIAVSVIEKLCENDLSKNPLIIRILRYVDNNYSEDISLKTLSAKFNANAAYLGRIFRNETGEMFTSYLNRVRVEKARELLLNSNLGVNDIALKVGYTNTKYFYEMFKKIIGENPLQFKRNSVNIL